MAAIGEAATTDVVLNADHVEAAVALPRLTGWKFALFRLVWFVALALAIGGTIAGIEIAALLDRPEGAQVRIGTRSPEGRLREHVLTRGRGHAAETYAASGITQGQRHSAELIADLAAVAVNIFAAAMLFRRRARDPVAAMLSLAFLVLVIGIGPAFDTFYLLGATGLPIAARAIGYGLLFAGITVFPQGRLETRWRRVLIAAISLWVFAFLLGRIDIQYSQMMAAARWTKPA